MSAEGTASDQEQDIHTHQLYSSNNSSEYPPVSDGLHSPEYQWEQNSEENNETKEVIKSKKEISEIEDDIQINHQQPQDGQSMVQCERCCQLPVNYIELNCGHSFCLDCMSLWFLHEGYDNLIDRKESNFDVQCLLCLESTLLDSDSIAAVKVLIQEIIAKSDESNFQRFNNSKQQQLFNGDNHDETSNIEEEKKEEVTGGYSQKLQQLKYLYGGKNEEGIKQKGKNDTIQEESSENFQTDESQSYHRRKKSEIQDNSISSQSESHQFKKLPTLNQQQSEQQSQQQPQQQQEQQQQHQQQHKQQKDYHSKGVNQNQYIQNEQKQEVQRQNKKTNQKKFISTQGKSYYQMNSQESFSNNNSEDDSRNKESHSMKVFSKNNNNYRSSWLNDSSQQVNKNKLNSDSSIPNSQTNQNLSQTGQNMSQTNPSMIHENTEQNQNQFNEQDNIIPTYLTHKDSPSKIMPNENNERKIQQLILPQPSFNVKNENGRNNLSDQKVKEFTTQSSIILPLFPVEEQQHSQNKSLDEQRNELNFKVKKMINSSKKEGLLSKGNINNLHSQEDKKIELIKNDENENTNNERDKETHIKAITNQNMNEQDSQARKLAKSINNKEKSSDISSGSDNNVINKENLFKVVQKSKLQAPSSSKLFPIKQDEQDNLKQENREKKSTTQVMSHLDDNQKSIDKNQKSKQHKNIHHQQAIHISKHNPKTLHMENEKQSQMNNKQNLTSKQPQIIDISSTQNNSNEQLNSILFQVCNKSPLKCKEHPLEEVGFFDFSGNRSVCLKCLQKGDCIGQEVRSFKKGVELLIQRLQETKQETYVSLKLINLTEQRSQEKHRKRMEESKQLRGKMDEQMVLLAQKLLKKHKELQQEAVDFEQKSQSKLQGEVNSLDNHKLFLASIDTKIKQAEELIQFQMSNHALQSQWIAFQSFEEIKNQLNQFIYDNEDLLSVSGTPCSSAKKQQHKQQQEPPINACERMKESLIDGNKNEELQRFGEQIAFLQKKIEELKGLDSSTHISLRNSLNYEQFNSFHQQPKFEEQQEKIKEHQKLYYYKSPRDNNLNNNNIQSSILKQNSSTYILNKQGQEPLQSRQFKSYSKMSDENDQSEKISNSMKKTYLEEIKGQLKFSPNEKQNKLIDYSQYPKEKIENQIAAQQQSQFQNKIKTFEEQQCENNEMSSVRIPVNQFVKSQSSSSLKKQLDQVNNSNTHFKVMQQGIGQFLNKSFETKNEQFQNKSIQQFTDPGEVRGTAPELFHTFAGSNISIGLHQDYPNVFDSIKENQNQGLVKDPSSMIKKHNNSKIAQSFVQSPQLSQQVDQFNLQSQQQIESPGFPQLPSFHQACPSFHYPHQHKYIQSDNCLEQKQLFVNDSQVLQENQNPLNGVNIWSRNSSANNNQRNIATPAAQSYRPKQNETPLASNLLIPLSQTSFYKQQLSQQQIQLSLQQQKVEQQLQQIQIIEKQEVIDNQHLHQSFENNQRNNNAIINNFFNSNNNAFEQQQILDNQQQFPLHPSQQYQQNCSPFPNKESVNIMINNHSQNKISRSHSNHINHFGSNTFTQSNNCYNNNNNSFTSHNPNNFSYDLKPTDLTSLSITNSASRYNTALKKSQDSSQFVDIFVPTGAVGSSIGGNNSFTKGKHNSQSNLQHFLNNNTISSNGFGTNISSNNNLSNVVNNTLTSEYQQNLSFHGAKGYGNVQKQGGNDTKSQGFAYQSLKKYQDLFKKQKKMMFNADYC